MEKNIRVGNFTWVATELDIVESYCMMWRCGQAQVRLRSPVSCVNYNLPIIWLFRISIRFLLPVSYSVIPQQISGTFGGVILITVLRNRAELEWWQMIKLTHLKGLPALFSTINGLTVKRPLSWECWPKLVYQKRLLAHKNSKSKDVLHQ